MLTLPDFVEKKIVIAFPKNGDKISFKNDNLLITDNFNHIKLQLSCYKLFALFIVGGFTLTSGLIEKSKKFGFSIIFFTYNFKVYSGINFKMEGNTLLRKKQYTTERSTEIAKCIIINKIENQRNILKKMRNPENAEGLIILNNSIMKLLRNEYDTYEIMGIEGIAAKVYFKRLFKEFDWKGRQPRVKRDKINLLLDIGYTVLFNFIEAILNIYGFDIYKGNLHKEFYQRKSLVCDMVEPFRPIIDYRIRKGYNLGQFNNYNFSVNNQQYSLDWKDSADFVNIILSELMEHKSMIFLYIQSYYRWFMKEKSIIEFPKAVL
jgi:CRISPR-associated endonuclease cas1